MAYRVRVTIEVVNEDDVPVSYKGYPQDSRNLTTVQHIKETDVIEDAHANMNYMHEIVKTIGKVEG